MIPPSMIIGISVRVPSQIIIKIVNALLITSSSEDWLTISNGVSTIGVTEASMGGVMLKFYIFW